MVVTVFEQGIQEGQFICGQGAGAQFVEDKQAAVLEVFGQVGVAVELVLVIHFNGATPVELAQALHDAALRQVEGARIAKGADEVAGQAGLAGAGQAGQ